VCNIKINEIFLSIQGEGIYAGIPSIFVRLSGCNLRCEWCDTDHKDYKEMKPEYVAELIYKMADKYFTSVPVKMNETTGVAEPSIIFTGGEPMLQIDDILQIIDQINIMGIIDEPDNDNDNVYPFHIETNGTILNEKLLQFDYISFSPKIYNDAEKCWIFRDKYNIEPECDIKIVSDGNSFNKDIIHFATIIMPLTTFEPADDIIIKERVWNQCIKLGKRYGSRLHVDIFGNKRGV